MKKSYVLVGVAAAVIVLAVILMYMNPTERNPSASTQSPRPPTTETKQPEKTPSPPSPTTTTTVPTPSQPTKVEKPAEPPKTETPQTEPPKTQTTTPPQTPPARITQTGIKNPDTLVRILIGDPVETLDPAGVYDTGSGEYLFNIYETLIFFDGDHPDKFIPWLATQVPSTENGLLRDNGLTYVFPILKGVKFHEGPVKDKEGKVIPGSGEVTPEDVEYSFARGMLQDRAGGPQWLLLEPLTGYSSMQDLVAAQLAEVKKNEPSLSEDQAKAKADLLACQTVKASVEVEGDNAVFHLKELFVPFLQLLVGSWGSILDKEWVIAQGGWDGTCETWRAHYDLPVEKSELFNKTNGTGPYKLEHWDQGKEVSLIRYDDYRRGPAKLKRIITKFNSEWTDRLLALQTGDADYVAIPPRHRDQIEDLIKKGLVKVYKYLPANSQSFFVFNQKVQSENNEQYLGSGKLDGKGIPADFFSDIHVRLAFNYSFDWETFIRDALDNDGVKSKGPLINTVFGFNPDQAMYELSLEKAKEHFKEAWGGKVWEDGFKIVVPTTKGGTVTKTGIQLLQKAFDAINPKFHIGVLELVSATITKDINEDKVPFYRQAWIEDFHDAHDWAYPMLGSQGYFSRLYNYPPELQKQLDDLILRGRKELDRDKRQAVYYELQQLAYENALYIFLEQDLDRREWRSWVQGWHYNPGYVGQEYFYELGKE